MNSWKISVFAFAVVCLAFTQAREVKLQSSSGELIGADIKIASVSGTIRGLLESVNLEEQKEIIIPFPTVSSQTIRHILTWAEQHKDDAPGLYDDKTKIVIPEWDQKFLKELKQEGVFEVILAANMMDVNGLLQIACKSVAEDIKGKTPEQIRKLFNIKNDFTAEEQEQIAANHNL